MSKDEALKLALEKINKAREKVAALCDGRERWTMSVPVRPDYDHDVVISSALSMAEDAIKQALEQPAPSDSGLTNRYTAAQPTTEESSAVQQAPVQPTARVLTHKEMADAAKRYTTPPVQHVARIAELEETVRQLNHALQEATEAPTFMGEPVVAAPTVRIKGFDEYGPMLDWYEHWVNFPVGTKLYTTPPAAQRPWVGLTNEEIIDVIHPLVMADMPD
jgi:hypothetical protein